MYKVILEEEFFTHDLFGMLKKEYRWKRFWCPRSGTINLDYEGYLHDPDSSEFGAIQNPDLVSSETISDIPCLILLGEPGMGKTQEIKELKKATENTGNKTLLYELGAFTNLKDDLFREEEFNDWLNGTYTLYLFLDSLDEGRLTIQNIAQGLGSELKRQKYENHINRLYLRITCRTFVFPENLEKDLREIWDKDAVKVYELALLRRADVATAIEDEGFSADNFLRQLRQKDLIPLATKPVTLRFLINTYRRHKGQFPSNLKRYELYLEGCQHLCEEVNPNRQAMSQLGSLDVKERIIVAARIAAITVFANRFAVWKGVNQGDVPAEDVWLQELYYSHENANERQFDVTREVVEEVLDTGLFSSRGSHRMGWAHQTYAEFLAAWYLVQHKVPLAQIKQLIFSSEDPDGKLVPQLHETAAWLASMRSDVLQAIIETDPDVLLQSDIPTDTDTRSSIVESLLIQHEEKKLFARYSATYLHYSKLSHPRLAAQLRPYLRDSSKPINVRELAIDIAEKCEVSKLQEKLVKLALDTSQPIDLRKRAANALCSIGDTYIRAKLKPLAIQPLPEDEHDELKGYALQAVWSDNIPAKELFRALTPPKKRNFFGGYQSFLSHHLVSKLQPDDLVVALDWLEKQGVRCFGHPFEELGDNILLRAWEHFDLPGVAESFTKVALVQWREFQRIITRDNKRQKQFESSLQNESQKRRILVEKAVLTVVETEEDPFFLLSHSTENTLKSEDLFWMLEMLQNTDSKTEQAIWVQLIDWNFNRQDVDHNKAILETTETNDIVRNMFELSVELNSERAERLKTIYARSLERKNHKQNSPLLEPPPKERVFHCLSRLEDGDLDAWWQLNMAMMLKPDSKYYDNEFELDLTKLPGWQEADEKTHKKIIEGAKKYIQQQDNIDYEWIGTNKYNRPALAGCRALQLLLEEDPGFLDNLPSEIWTRWASVIIAVCNNNLTEDSHLELAKRAYLNAPEECTKTLIRLIDQENQESHDCIYILSRFRTCWDERLTSILLEKLKDPTLKPKFIGQLLDELLKRKVAEARNFAESLVDFPLPSNQEEREKALITAKALVEHSDQTNWSFIWSLIEKDTSFGREVFELVVNRHWLGLKLDLSERQIADLYIWLVHQYPHNEDPDHTNETLAHDVTTRDSMVRLRDGLLTQLQEKGTHQACTEIQRLAQELPHLIWLENILADAKANMRRKTWQPRTPEEILQLIMILEPSNSEISSKIDEVSSGFEKMSKEPRINISGNSGSNINFNAAQNGKAEQKIESQNKQGINWSGWIGITISVIGVMVAVMTIFFNGLFNDEVKELLNPNSLPEMEEKVDDASDPILPQ